MGFYFNPGYDSFKRANGSRIYIYKTGLLEELNLRISSEENCILLSHARRFGKSQAAGMIKAYYSCGCDSREIFSRFEISKSDTFSLHLNRYNVIHLDISSFIDFHKEDLVDEIIKRLTLEFSEVYAGDINLEQDINLILCRIAEFSDKEFIIIIDEWDSVIRNHADRPDLVHRYLQFLHSLFKSEESKRFLALGYITGILPIKKIKDESALNNFREYTMIHSGVLTRYFGFTENEVKALCKRFDMDFDDLPPHTRDFSRE